MPEDSQDFIVAGVCHLDAISILLNTLSKTLGGDFQKKIDRKYHYYFIFLKPSLSQGPGVEQSPGEREQDHLRHRDPGQLELVQ